MVAGLRAVGPAADPAAALIGDPVPRVRVGALRALGAVGEHEHVAGVLEARDDPEPAVRRAATRAEERLRTRLDLA